MPISQNDVLKLDVVDCSSPSIDLNSGARELRLFIRCRTRGIWDLLWAYLIPN